MLQALSSFLLLLVFIPLEAQPEPILSYQSGQVAVWPVSLDAGLTVYRGTFTLTETGNKTPILGRRATSADTLFFRPLVPFAPGEAYTAVYAGALVHHFRAPLPADYARAAIEYVYPSADTLPVNLLKFHLRFSRPMQAGKVYSYITLLTEAGDIIDRAILPLEPPLWTADRTVLTLWLEPGRIKRDLGPNRMLGPILETGKQYVLAIDAAMKDENGLPLAAGFRQRFHVGERDTLRPDPGSWRLVAPKPAAGTPLSVHFGESLDWATVTTYLQVQNPAGKPVPGEWQVSDGERQATFLPVRPWRKGRYRLLVDPKLEDVAGNNLRRLFDREVGAQGAVEDIPVLEFYID